MIKPPSSKRLLPDSRPANIRLSATDDVSPAATHPDQECLVALPKPLRFKWSAVGVTHGPGPAFRDGARLALQTPHQLKAHLLSGTLSPYRVPVLDASEHLPTFAQHGIEYHHLPENICAMLSDAATDLTTPGARLFLRDALRHAVTPWAQDLFGAVEAVPVDAVYRTSTPNSAFSPLHLFHTDFRGSSADVLESFGNTWKLPIERAVGHALQDSTYRRLPVVEMFNVWMPLVPVRSNHLALCDRQTLRPSDTARYSAVRRTGQTFDATLVKPAPHHACLVWPGMSPGMAVAFSSIATAHTAMNLQGETEAVRSSLEMRFVVVPAGVTLASEGAHSTGAQTAK